MVATGAIPTPSSWLLENADLIPATESAALDVACGSGRNALFLTAAGLRVRAVDRDAAALSRVSAYAADLGLTR
jgi:methylase of polypeptide subunit release factors